MDNSLIISLISGVIAVFSVILNFIISRRIENLKYNFQEQLYEKNARRDYEYEARKKLYTEYEPIFFKFAELSESALSRVKSLSRSSREGKLDPTKGWLSSDAYYLRSTIYMLFTPLASYRLMREKINLVDLRLDRDVSMQYVLAKLINRIFSSDFEFANQNPQIEYAATNSTMRNELGKENPQKYWRQGLAIGELDQFIETLIKNENGARKIVDFGEFNDNIDEENSTSKKRYDHINYIFSNFRPDKKPILWRMLIAQSAIYYIISKARFSAIDFSIESIKNYLAEFEQNHLGKFDYQNEELNIKKFEEDKVTFQIVQKYITENIDEILGNAK